MDKRRLNTTKKEVLKLLESLGVLHKVDEIMVELFCKELYIYHLCMKNVEKEGVVTDYNNGRQQMQQINPNYKAAKIALENAFRIGKELGVTVPGRLAIEKERQPKQDERIDPLSNLRKVS